MIFVSVGTERFPFDRLVKAADQAARTLNGEKMFIQLGYSRYVPQRCTWRRFLPYEELIEQIKMARIVVSHAGTGLILLCAQLGKVPIVMPRRKQFDEHVDDHQVELATRVAELGRGMLAEDPDAITPLIRQYEKRHLNLAHDSSTELILADVISACLTEYEIGSLK